MYASMMADELGIDIKDSLGILKQWGFKHVDLRWRLFGQSLEDLNENQTLALKAHLDEHYMGIGMLHTSIGKVKNPEDPGVMADQLAKAERTIRASEILGAKRVRIFPLRPDEFTDFNTLDENSPWWERILKLNEPVFALFKQAGCSIAVENGPFHINDALNLVKAFSSYNAGIAWDLMGGWILRDQAEPVNAYFARVAPWIRNIHVKMFALPGYEHNFEMTAEGETAGIVPWKQLLTAIDASGGDGPISVETQQALILHDAPDVLTANHMLAKFVLKLASGEY